MPRPQNKDQLLLLGQERYNDLMSLINGLAQEDQEREFIINTMNRNIRDVLMHLHHWHLLMLNWYAVGMNGEKPEMPAPGYTWEATKELNLWIWEQYQTVSLTEAKTLFSKSYRSIRQLIESHSDQELFQKKKYKWTGSTSLGAYLISASSSHYHWAIKLIKRDIRSRKKSS